MGYIIGISAYYHDSAACLISDTGKIIFAAHEERFTRKKHDASFPTNVLRELKNSHNVEFENIDAVVFYEKPYLKLARVIDTVLSNVPKSFSFFSHFMWSLSANDKGYQGQIIKGLEKVWGRHPWSKKIKFSQHHFSHAASALCTSPFEEATIITIDGVGEEQTSTIMRGTKDDIECVYSSMYPNSLGFFILQSRRFAV